MARLGGIVQPEPVSYTAELGTESVTVVFDSAKMTGRWEVAVNAAIRADDTETMFREFCRVFISWDVVDDSGAPVALTADLLLDLPSRAVTALLDGMRDAAVPSDAEKNGSSASVSVPLSAVSPAASPVSRNGLETSMSPTPSASPSLT